MVRVTLSMVDDRNTTLDIFFFLRCLTSVSWDNVIIVLSAVIRHLVLLLIHLLLYCLSILFVES